MEREEKTSFQNSNKNERIARNFPEVIGLKGEMKVERVLQISRASPSGDLVDVAGWVKKNLCLGMQGREEDGLSMVCYALSLPTNSHKVFCIIDPMFCLCVQIEHGGRVRI